MFKADYFALPEFAEDRKARFPRIDGKGGMFPQEIVHNGGWYNQRGEEIGWGDLSAPAINGISSRLCDDELIVVITELGRNRRQNEGGFQKKYDLEYLAEHALYVLVSGVIINVRNWDVWKFIDLITRKRDTTLPLWL